MCLILAGWRAHPRYRLIVAANRDEYYSRSTEPMRPWTEVAGLLAGRDLGAGTAIPGTWLGVLPPDHRVAAVTNVRGPAEKRTDARSRGALLMDYLRGTASPATFLRDTASAPDDYNGYNLLVSDLTTLWWHSNRSPHTPRELPPGLHGLSNGAQLGSLGTTGSTDTGCTDTSGSPNTGAAQDVSRHIDTAAVDTDDGTAAWPKVRDGLVALRTVIESDPDDVAGYFDVLADRTPAPDRELPTTGLSHEDERSVSPRFIAHTVHGTRCSTVLLVREDGTYTLTERSFGRLGRPAGEVSFAGNLPLPDRASPG